MLNFTGREKEILELQEAWNQSGSKLTVLYGRRRVGKSTLINKAYGGKLLKFEGLENKKSAEQKKHFIAQLVEYFKDAELLLYEKATWTKILQQLSLRLKKKPVVILFDEFQWMAVQRSALVSELKYAWDNYFQLNNNIHLILCGSVSSFIVRKVLRSKALYGRVNLTINLKPLYLDQILPAISKDCPLEEALDYYFAFGGIPEYWNLINQKESSTKNIAKLCFGKHSYFKEEIEKIFISHFGNDTGYRKIIEYLAKVNYASHQEILIKTRLTSGGNYTRSLEDLEFAGFIKIYTPVLSGPKSELKRYYLSDPYLRFYYKFIKPNLDIIENSRQPVAFKNIVTDQQLSIWRGISLEKICLLHADLIAKLIGFNDVRYRHGAYFKRQDQESGFQIDLMFIRDDRVITICEMKNLDSPVGVSVIDEVKKKIVRLDKFSKYRIQKILITGSNPSPELVRRDYFDRIIKINEIFSRL